MTASNEFYDLEVTALRDDTPNAKVVTFGVPEELTDIFQFRAGQYLTLEHDIDGESIRRSYSLCSSPAEPGLSIGVKRVTNGRFSNFINDRLAAGDRLRVMAPTGSFYTQLDANNAKNYLLIAAGSGITPVLSLLKSTLANEPKSRATLIFGNQSTATMMFRNDLCFLKNRYLARFHWINIFSRQPQASDVLNGRIDNRKGAQLNRTLINLGDFDEFFLCGPESMISEVSRGLTEFGIDDQKIHYELFASSAEDAQRIVEKHHERAVRFKGKSSRVELIKGGREFHFDLPRDGENLLDAGAGQGADLPFSCKAGICATCKCKLIEGEVEMDIEHGLQAEEKAAGYILSCQAHPVSAKVRVDFDQF